MANVYAVKSGNWSDPTVWNTGSLPSTQDDVWSNKFIVNIDTSPTVLSIRNKSTAGILAGGGFTINDNTIITCTGEGIIGEGINLTGGTEAICIRSNLAQGELCTINSDIQYVGQKSPSYTLVHNGLGTIDIQGSILSNTINDNGGSCIENRSLGTINIVGNLVRRVRGREGSCVRNMASGVINITGDIVDNSPISFAPENMIINNSSGTINVTGNIFGLLSTTGRAIENTIDTGIINIVGNVISQASTESPIGAIGITNVVGALIASNSSPAVRNTSLLTCVFTGPFICSDSGVQAVAVNNWKLDTSLTNTYLEVQTNDLAVKRTLYTAGTLGGIPDPYDVRLGVEYGPNNDLTGTCIIPPPAAVQAAVPVDDTFGTGEFASSPEGFWNKPLSELETTTPEGSVGRRMAKLPTAQLIAEYLAAYERV